MIYVLVFYHLFKVDPVRLNDYAYDCNGSRIPAETIMKLCIVLVIEQCSLCIIPKIGPHYSTISHHLLHRLQYLF